jgi:hypothetical protein
MPALKKGKSKTEMGDIVDVRSAADAEKLKGLMKDVNITIILVYADWCPHCHTYKDDVWKNLTAIPASQRKTGLASIQAEHLKSTPFANAKLKGYPSVIVVGKDGRPAEFKDEDTGQSTNALPNSRKLEMMKKMVTSDPDVVLPAGSALSPNRRNKPLNKEFGAAEKPLVDEDFGEEFDLMTTPKSVDESLMLRREQQPRIGGGALFQSLMKAAQMVGPAALLTVAGAVASRKRGRKKSKRASKTRRYSK